MNLLFAVHDYLSRDFLLKYFGGEKGVSIINYSERYIPRRDFMLFSGNHMGYTNIWQIKDFLILTGKPIKQTIETALQEFIPASSVVISQGDTTESSGIFYVVRTNTIEESDSNRARRIMHVVKYLSELFENKTLVITPTSLIDSRRISKEVAYALLEGWASSEELEVERYYI